MTNNTDVDEYDDLSETSFTEICVIGFLISMGLNFYCVMKQYRNRYNL